MGRLRAIVAIMVFIVVSVNYAQDEDEFAYVLNLDTSQLTTASWSSDSQVFTFFDFSNIQARSEDEVLQGVNLSQELWETFDLKTMTLNQSNRWPLQADLTSTELSLFMPLNFIYASPSGKFIAYAHDVLIDEYALGYPLALVDRETQELKELNIPILTNSSPGNVGFNWSDNESALALWYFAPDGTPVFQYVDFQTGVSEAVAYEFLEVQAIRYSPIEQFVEKLYDISPNGDYVLLTARPLLAGDIHTAPSELILWSPRNPENSQIVSGFDGRLLTAACFSPENSSELIIVSENQILLYDMDSQNTTILNTTIVTPPQTWTIFSPDCHWLAIGEEGYGRIRFVNMLAVLDSN